MANPADSAAARPLRVGVIGAGSIGVVHARSARRAGAEVVAAVGSAPERAGTAASKVGAQRGYPDLAALLRECAVDVVHVCTPNASHADLALTAVRAGVHVVCEKPLTTDPESARLLTSAAERAGVVGTVPFVYRFHPMAREFRARVAAGETGRPALLHGHYLQDWLSRAAETNWRVSALAGGRSRAFADIGSHWCDLAEFVSGQRIARLSARTSTVAAHRGPLDDARAVDTEDSVSLSFVTDGEVLGSAVICQVAAGRKNRVYVELSGTDTSLAFNQEEPEMLWVGRREGSAVLIRDPDALSPEAARYCTLPAGHAQGYQDCFDNFVADTYAVIGGAPVPTGLPTFADGLRSTEITAAVLTSAENDGTWVDVPPPDPTQGTPATLGS
ncbi:MAG: Gfo/Idh/MocA family oxidoreductase [Actinomycetota bacterium]|nr:Gfo/Idh/MocA family oxidoreductase [Actinomycetota bacterium]